MKSYFTPQQQQQIVDAIKEAELVTSGEIRVHIESECKIDVLDRAAWIFKKLEMHQTNLQNGILIYVAVKSQKFAIIGDVGINKLVAENFWDNIKTNMQQQFAQGNSLEAIVYGVKEAGIALKQYFPYQSNDINERPDEISFGE